MQPHHVGLPPQYSEQRNEEANSSCLSVVQYCPHRFSTLLYIFYFLLLRVTNYDRTSIILMNLDHDLSMATPNTVNQTIPPNNKVQESVEKFIFRPFSSQSNMEVASVHYDILCKINDFSLIQRSSITMAKQSMRLVFSKVMMNIYTTSNFSLLKPIIKKNSLLCTSSIIKYTHMFIFWRFDTL